ncbi:hypothetical protein RJZ56_005244 [Blastomyces dermatitidis]|uniref:Immunogenic protein n=2 Tax=Ajellomyces dermatitidis TaxID=5039 RepID=F2TUU6_AJEDA|nr:immunogenic protein [Blastomyces dermatitidis ER-3]EEQ88117.1 immunogenic protein [Blastomyces dermatitidis ER-3]EGE87009.1 immunogenic protein [Blastomyces dermatitidis ATCC 18188]
MSEVQKPVEEVPAATPATEPSKDAPAASAAETPAETAAPATNEPAANAPSSAEEPTKEEPNAEIKPASEGVLGYKAPGLVKGFRFSKRFCWFSDDAVEVKQLSTYFQNEKLSVAHPTAAWASQTGKGLLFLAKRAEDKTAPTGIINLADISDVTKESSNEFQFKLAGHKHTFQAASSDERDSWVAAIEAKAADAKNEKETITSSEGYKAELEKLTKPPALAAATPKKEPAKEVEEGEKKEEEDKKDEKKPEQEEKKSEQKEKSRSQSRKRASIFGNFLAKKDEEKKEEKKEEKAEAKDDKKDEPEAAAPAAETAAPAESAEAPAAAAEEPKAEEKKPEAKSEPATTAKAKRASIFGNIFQKVGNQDKAEKESAPKTSETAVSSTAPQLGDPVDASTSEPIKPETVTAAGEPAQPAKEAEEPVASPTSTKSGFLNFIKKEMKHDDKKEAAKPEEKAEKKHEETPAEPAAAETIPPAVKEKRRTSLFGTLGSKKEKKPESTTDGEQATEEDKAKSPGQMFGGVFRRVSKAGKKEKEPAAATSESEPIPEAAEKPEPISKDAPADPPAAVNGTEAEEKADATAPTSSSSQPVQAAA